MAKLTGKSRENIPTEKFAIPELRKLPLNDAAHVRNAAARVDQVQGASSEQISKAHKRIAAAESRLGIGKEKK